MRWIGGISPAIIREVPARVRWTLELLRHAGVDRISSGVTIFFSEQLCEIHSRGIAKRVTPLRRCESIRSLDRHRWQCAVCLTRIIHECRREAFETEARRGFSQVRPTEAYLRSVEEAEREKPRRDRGSDDVAGIHE